MKAVFYGVVLLFFLFVCWRVMTRTEERLYSEAMAERYQR